LDFLYLARELLELRNHLIDQHLGPVDRVIQTFLEGVDFTFTALKILDEIENLQQPIGQSDREYFMYQLWHQDDLLEVTSKSLDVFQLLIAFLQLLLLLLPSKLRLL
jgi:hypothetical protein